MISGDIAVEECGTINYNLPHSVSEEFKDVYISYSFQFMDKHLYVVISSQQTLVKVPPRHIPAHYHAEIKKQID